MPSSSDSDDPFSTLRRPPLLSERLQSILTTTAPPPPQLHSSNSEPFPTVRLSAYERTSRSLSCSLPSSSCGGTGSSERGMIGFARSRDATIRNVAVVGKAFLKILRVPAAARTTSTFEELPPNSSLAARRSRARNNAALSVDEPDQIEEILDVRSGARLGPAYLFSDVKWGYGATANKLATSLSNGAVILWDLDKEGPNKVDQLKYEHDRSVNRIIFGGASGSWLMSGGQDGLMKLWDIREAKPASLVLKASSPVLQLAFSPSVSQPFSLLATCASGTMIRYDIRYTGRGGGGATDRIAGHVGACLAMDWRDTLDTEGVEESRKEGGYVVTGGMDGVIKIWDFSLASLSTKPVRVLQTGRPVKDVKWHSSANKLVSCSVPSMSLGRNSVVETVDGESVDDAGYGARGVGARLDRTSSHETPKGGGSEWKNEIEIWDIRRESFPAKCIKTLQPTSAVLFNEDDTIWSTSSSSATFRQHDLRTDTYSPLDTFPRPSAVWNIQGEMAFIEEPTRRCDDYSENVPVEKSAFRPETSIATISNFDPDYDQSTFEMLANNYMCGGRAFGELCEINAEVARSAHRLDAVELWNVLKTWFDEDDDVPLSPPASPTPQDTHIFVHSDTSPTAPSSRPISPLRLDDLQLVSPPPIPSLYHPTSSRTRRSYSNPMSQTRSFILSPVVRPIEHPLGLIYHDSLPSTSSHSTPSSSSQHFIPATAPVAGLDFVRNPSSLSRQHPFLPSTLTTSDTVALMRRRSSATTKERVIPPFSNDLWSESDDERPKKGKEKEREIIPIIGPGSGQGRLGSPGTRSVTTFALPTTRGSGSKGRKNKLDVVSSSSSSSSASSAEDEDEIDDTQEEKTDIDSPPITEGELVRRSSGSSSSRFKSTILPQNSSRRRSTFSHHALSKPTSLFGSEGHSHRSRKAFLTDIAGGGGGGGGGGLMISTFGLGSTSSSSLSTPIVGGNTGVGGFERLMHVRKASMGSSRIRREQRLEEESRKVALEREREVRRQEKVEERRVRGVLKEEERIRVEGMRERVRKSVRETLAVLADRGDNQLCATVCCVLQNKAMQLHPMFVARLSKAYLDLLGRAQLYTASAGLIKYCTTELIRASTQQNIVFHTNCHCGKLIEQPPYDLCRRCNTSATNCAICHLPIRSLLSLCSKCNHVAHPSCLVSHSQSITSAPLSGPSLATHEGNIAQTSYPSTPGYLAPTIRAWMWGEEEDDVTDGGESVRRGVMIVEDEKRKMLKSCPNGNCACVDCALSLAMVC